MSTELAVKPARKRSKMRPSRDELLDAAGILMTELGTIDVSLADIAQRSGLNSALVKYYFGSKSGLLMALLEKILGRSLEQMSGLCEMDLSPVTKLSIHVRAVINIYFRYPYVNRLIHYIFNDPVFGPQVAARVSVPLAETQRRLLQEGIDAGVFRAIDPMHFSFIVLGACDHFFFSRQILRTAFNIDEIKEDHRARYADTLVDILLAGLVVQPKAD